VCVRACACECARMRTMDRRKSKCNLESSGCDVCWQTATRVGCLLRRQPEASRALTRASKDKPRHLSANASPCSRQNLLSVFLWAFTWWTTSWSVPLAGGPSARTCHVPPLSCCCAELVLAPPPTSHVCRCRCALLCCFCFLEPFVGMLALAAAGAARELQNPRQAQSRSRTETRCRSQRLGTTNSSLKHKI
jgi:hypothetical protein